MIILPIEDVINGFCVMKVFFSKITYIILIWFFPTEVYLWLVVEVINIFFSIIIYSNYK